MKSFNQSIIKNITQVKLNPTIKVTFYFYIEVDYFLIWSILNFMLKWLPLDLTYLDFVLRLVTFWFDPFEFPIKASCLSSWSI
jgi:hypothetical protein